jgi:Fur family iron response transcriptional regulator
MESFQLLDAACASRRLIEHGLVPTQQRTIIAQILFAADRHWAAEHILATVAVSGHTVSKATVYNTLNSFRDCGLVREVIVDPKRVFYDPNVLPHHHFYNVDSGELIDIDAQALELRAALQLPPNTVTEGVDIIVRIRGS